MKLQGWLELWVNWCHFATHFITLLNQQNIVLLSSHTIWCFVITRTCYDQDLPAKLINLMKNKEAQFQDKKFNFQAVNLVVNFDESTVCLFETWVSQDLNILGHLNRSLYAVGNCYVKS